MSVAFTHADLVQRAAAWLKRKGCRVVLHDPFRVPLAEQPDAIGWREGASILVECKVSRADFLADRAKPFRVDPARGMADWRFMLAPPGVIRPDDLPEGWGLLQPKPTRGVAEVMGVPSNTQWWRGPFHDRCDKRAEIKMLTSALAQPHAIPRGKPLRQGIDVSELLEQWAEREGTA